MCDTDKPTTTTSNCCCDCGTRIVIDQQLLQQRQMWKDKYTCLQRQMLKQIAQIKQTIYTQCSTLMQTEFQNKQKEQAKLINKKHSQIQQLTSRIITYQTTIKVITRQKEIHQQKISELQDEIKDKDRLINMLKSQSLKTEHDWQEKLQNDMANFRKKLLAQNKHIIDSLQTQNQHLQHKLKDLQKKYNIIIPQVEKLKSALNQKTSALQTLQQKYDKLKRDHDKEIANLLLEKEEIQRTHSTCRAEIIKLNQKLSQTEIQIRNHKKLKNQVKVEPIYIEKPVHVQKIVQKIIPIQKVIKEYIEPQKFKDQVLEHQYSKLKAQNDRILKENHHLQKKLNQTIKDYELILKDYDTNIQKYKAERQSLAKKIQQLNKQLDIVYTVKKVDSYQRQQQPAEPQKVKVYVKNDGISQYYSTGPTIPRIMTVSSPRNAERETSRNTSRNKPLSTSQSSKKVIWK